MMLAGLCKTFIEQQKLDVYSLSAGVKIVVVNEKQVVAGTLLSKDRDSLLLHTKDDVKVKVNFCYWHPPICLPLNEEVMRVIDDIMGFFRVYAIFESLGHMNNASNVELQLKLQSFVKQIPEEALDDLERIAFSDRDVKECYGMLALSGPSSPDKFAGEFITSVMQ